MSSSAPPIRLRARALTRLSAEHLDPLEGLADDDWRPDRPDEEAWLIEPEGAEAFLLRRFRWRTPNHAFDDARPVGSLFAKGRWLWSDGWAPFEPELPGPNAFSEIALSLPMPAFEGWRFSPSPAHWIELPNAPDNFRSQWAWLLAANPAESPDLAEQALLAAAEAAVLSESISQAVAQSPRSPRV